MSLLVPSFAAHQFATPLTNAYAWVSGLAIDFGTGAGRATINVHPDVASALASKPPIDQVTIGLGDILVPAQGQTPAVTFPTLSQLVASATAEQKSTPTLDPFAALRAAIYSALISHPLFVGSTQVA